MFIITTCSAPAMSPDHSFKFLTSIFYGYLNCIMCINIHINVASTCMYLCLNGWD